MSRFGQPSTIRPSTVIKRSYFSDFTLTENPISEGGAWNRRSLGWAPVITASGRAYGAQNAYAGGVAYDDSYAFLTGQWSPNCEIITEQYASGGATGIVECEHEHRVIDVAGAVGNVQLYEFNWNPEGDYCNWYRWAGEANDLGDFIQLATGTIDGGVQDGDYIRTRMIGNAMTAWIDRRSGAGWEHLLSATDTAGAGGGAVLTSGAPGMGFYWESGASLPSTYGFKWIQVREL